MIMAIPTTLPPTQEINYGYIIEGKKDVFTPHTSCRKATAEDWEEMVEAERQRKIRSEARFKELTELEATNKKSLSGGDLIELIIIRGQRKIQR